MTNHLISTWRLQGNPQTKPRFCKHQLLISSSTWIQVLNGLNPWKDSWCCLLEKSLSRCRLLVLSTKLKRTWLQKHAEKIQLVEKNSLCSIFYTFSQNSVEELYKEFSELTSPLDDFVMRKLFCMNLWGSLSVQINNTCTSWSFKKCNLLEEGGRLYGLNCLFQLWKIKNRFNSNATNVSLHAAATPSLPSPTPTAGFPFFSALSVITRAEAAAESSRSGTLKNSEKRYNIAWTVDIEFQQLLHEFLSYLLLDL